MIEIRNLRWTNKNFEHEDLLIGMINDKLKTLNVKAHVVSDSCSIIVKPMTANKFFISTVKNKIKIAPHSKRAQQKGKNVLDTNRPTKEQYYGFFNSINDSLDMLMLSADVHLDIKGNKVTLRAGKIRYDDAIPKQKGFPVKL